MYNTKEVNICTRVRLRMRVVHSCHDYCACVAYIDNFRSVYFAKEIIYSFCLYTCNHLYLCNITILIKIYSYFNCIIQHVPSYFSEAVYKIFFL